MNEPQRESAELAELIERIERCMLADQPGLRRRLRGGRRSRGRPPAAPDLAAAAGAIERSVERRERRRAALPAPDFPASLPIVEHREEIAAAITEHQVVVICGETGSGKTTQLPKICLDLGRGAGGAIGLTQPRRLAARAVAGRIAQELGTTLGEAIGYQVRFDDRVGPDCLVKIMTDGILLAETRGDRQLRRYDTIILDEAHERSLNIDFLLGFLKRLLPRRPELRLVIASATIDPQRFSEHFGGAPIIEVSGRVYPVEVRYRPPQRDDPETRDADMIEAIGAAIDEIESEGAGDVLVFLSGEREIRETAKALRVRAAPGTEILPLYARLPAAEQARIFASHPGRRIVLATNVAETSLTVPGIRYVVDTGLARVSRYSVRRRVQRLPIEPISRASAIQRAGRCGRVAEGVCIRLYAERDWERRDEHTMPELLRSNLAGVVLQMKALDLGDAGDFPWLDPPRASVVRDALETLRELAAIDDQERLTPLGRRLAALPVDPRLGRMLLAAAEERCLDEALIIASALAVQDPRVRPMEGRAEADRAHRRFDHPGSDFLSLVNLWRFYREERTRLTWSRLRERCTHSHLSLVRLLEWHDVHRQLKRLALEAGMRIEHEPAEDAAIHQAVLAGLLSNIGRRGERGEYDGARGSTFRIFPGSVLGLSRAGDRAEADPDADDAPAAPRRPSEPAWLMAAEIVETTRRYARVVAGVEPEWIERQASHLVRRHHLEPRWDRRSGRVVTTERVTLFGLELIAGRRVDFAPIDPVAAREIFIREALVRGRCRGRPPFLQHNLALVESIERLEARLRSRELLVDEAGRCAYYDERLPADVCSVAGLDAWRRGIEPGRPRALFMERCDVVRRGAEEVDEARYPGRLVVGGASLPLTYLHEPGDPGDGVTVRVPLPALNQLDEVTLDWLVPGMLPEKVVAMLRGLPKSVRRSFVPAAEHAETVCRMLQPSGRRPLTEAVGEALRSLTGVGVPQDAWSTERIPPHLRMNVEVVGEDGAVVARGRDLEAIRRSLAPQARRSFERAHGERYRRDGITAWDMGDLPPVVELDGAGGLIGHPTLLDRGDSVSLRLLEDEGQSLAEGRIGLRRLIALQLPDDLDAHLQHLPQIESMERLWTPLGPIESLHDGLVHQLVDRAFLGAAGPDAARDEATFDALVAAGRDRLWEVGLAVGALVERILAARHEVELSLTAERQPEVWNKATEDMRMHLGELTAPGFLVATPAGWLDEYPRYLDAIARRHAKLAGGGHQRDARQMAIIAPLQERCRARRAADAKRSILDPQLEHYRWMLEELAVSLHAQELRTAIPVSEKRLAKQWELVGRR